MLRRVATVLAIALFLAGCAENGGPTVPVVTTTTAPAAATTIPGIATTAAPTTSTPSTTTAGTTTATTLPPVNQLAAGLFCRDLAGLGYEYPAAAAYWGQEGNPSRMDADNNGIPCETVFPTADVVAFWGDPLPTTTTTVAVVIIHVFPLDPVDAGSYSPGGHPYPATDIFAPIGTPFVAVTSGEIQGVSRTDIWDPEVDDGATKAGLFVSLIGDDGVRYYGSHLSEVAEGIEAGVRVEAGQQLGLVGISGSARDTPPHLHFGISRPTVVEDWEVRRGEVDPVPFLDAWRGGDTTATPSV